VVSQQTCSQQATTNKLETEARFGSTSQGSPVFVDSLHDEISTLFLDHEKLDEDSFDAANFPRQRAKAIQKVSILIPLYNERWTIKKLLKQVAEAPLAGLQREIIVVDDGSTDGGSEVAAQVAKANSCVKLLHHPKNLGKGAAVRTAIRNMTGDVAIIQDADLEYSPSDFEQLIEPIISGDADAVYGSRFSGPRRRALLFWNSLGNKVLTTASNIINDINLTDMETCYKAVRADILRELRLTSKTFTIEPEITTRLAQWGARIYEVPIGYRGRSKEDGRKTRAWDGIKALGKLLHSRFVDTRFTLHTGMYVLRSVENARRYNKWTIDQIGKYLGKRVAEAGSGIGNMSQMLTDREHLLLVDHDPMYTASLEDRFAGRGNVRVQQTDLTEPDFEKDWKEDRLDTVFCSNVLEHLGPHRRILKSFYNSITPGGHCIIVVPAEPELYNGLDTSLGHHRRYRRQDLSRIMQEAGFEVVHQQQVCKLGAVAWWINGNLLRRRRLTPRQMRVFDWLWPLFCKVDRLLPWRGMSLMMVGRKPSVEAEDPSKNAEDKPAHAGRADAE
jgi:glycosyltransferase involved in cell wall biosynthesis